LHPLVIGGTSNVTVNAINDFGIMAGVYNSTTGEVFGFVGSSSTITQLLLPNGAASVPNPLAINNNGTVVGQYYMPWGASGFTWSSGEYRNYFSLGASGNNAPVPNIAASGSVSFNFYQGDGIYTAFAGPPNAPGALGAGFFPQVVSVNSSDEAAGEYEPYVNGVQQPAVFLSGNKGTAMISPPDATSSYGGYVNDGGMVAGSYTNRSGQVGGFVYRSRRYQTFIPAEASISVTVQGIDAAGHVVGVYQDEEGSHVFIYREPEIVTIGTFEPSEIVHASISPRGSHLALSVTAQGSAARSYQISCRK
jgi:hypothetical protein